MMTTTTTTMVAVAIATKKQDGPVPEVQKQPKIPANKFAEMDTSLVLIQLPGNKLAVACVMMVEELTTTVAVLLAWLRTVGTVLQVRKLL